MDELIMNEQILNDAALREKLIGHYEVLDKVKNLLLIPNTDFITIKQVATYYEVDIETVKKTYQRNKDEFQSDGVCIKKYKEILMGHNVPLENIDGKYVIRLENGKTVEIPNRGINIFPRRAILRMGMLLRDSFVAKEVKNQLRNINEKQGFIFDIDKEEDSTMNELMIFSNEEFGEVRTIVDGNEPLFVGKDVAEALGYKDTSDALKRHVNTDDKLTRCFTDSGQNRKMIVINESGLYALIFGSKLESAQRFKQWVTSEVLPSIRKTGGYVNNDELFINTYLPFADDQTKELFRVSLINSRKQNEIIAAQKKQIKAQQETIEQKTQENAVLQSDNDILAKEILTWTDRSKLNFGIRKLSKVTGIHYSKLWNELYKQLKYKYSIDVKARAKKDYIKTIREDEWKRVTKSFAAICNSYNQSPTKMLDETE